MTRLPEAVIAGQLADSIGRALYSAVQAGIEEYAREDARYALNSLRCVDCDLMYVERRQYACKPGGFPSEKFPLYGAGHRFEKTEVDAISAIAEVDTNG